MNIDRNAPFAGWTPELIEQASSAYQAEQEAIDRIRHEAYAQGRKDERENLERIGAVRDCPHCGGRGERMVTMGEGPHIHQDLIDCPDCQGTGYACTEGLIRAVRDLPFVNSSEIDGEESDGTPRHYRSRRFVSLTKLERLLRGAPR